MNQVQGLDYAYTLQGWLKGVNTTAILSTASGSSFDMGRDGINIDANANTLVSRDAYGFSLNYYTGDYKTISTTVSPFATVPMSLPVQFATNIATGGQLFNSNIGAMLVNIPQVGSPNLYGYKYDQLNRLVRMDAFNGLNQAGNNFAAAPVRVDDYHEEISYDPNGNINTYLRNGDSRSNNMDNLGYNYVANTNQLNYVTDAVITATPAGYTDIKNQAPNNYAYDNIGNLVSDNLEGISNIDWSVYGKIRMITKTNGTIIKYGYDAAGNRISKIITTTTPSVTGDSTYYVRDASSNVMSVYNKKSAANLLQTELHIYGSSRLGVYNVNLNVQNCPYLNPPAVTIFTRGIKFFELSNHLGNVLATVTDKQMQHTSDGNTVDYYTANISSATDYYPYGLRIAAISSKKLGDVNEGQLKNQYQYQGDYSEFDEDLGWNDFQLRSYDPQIGRFIQQDPYSQFPSPYTGMGNDPVNNVDPSGGFSFDFGTVGDVTGSVFGDRALAAGVGAILGFGIDKLFGGNGWKGAAIGAGVGLGATFIQPGSIDGAGKTLEKAGELLPEAQPFFDAVNKFASFASHSQNDDWNPLYKSGLQLYFRQQNNERPGTENELGTAFEKLFAAFSLTDPIMRLSNVRPNGNNVFTGGFRNTAPDFVGDAYVGSKKTGITSIKGADWYELKQKQGGLYLSSNEDQIAGHIDNLRNSSDYAYRKYGRLGYQSKLYIVTTADVKYSEAIYERAVKNNVLYEHIHAEYRMVNNNWQFRFKKTVITNQKW